SLLIGPELADITNLTQYYLPKAAIDKTTSRMTELLKQRLPNVKEEKPSDVELDLIGPVMRSS
ncbi:MAG: hypothetical protein ACTJFM_09060, partial [Pseudoalteromonas sp.]